MKSKNKILKRFLAFFLSFCVFCALCYSIFVFSDIPFIKKWRTIYIETAMTTMTHQWLATSFIPNNIVQEVMQNSKEQNSIQIDLESNWDEDSVSEEILENKEEKNEVNTEEIQEDIAQNKISEKDLFYEKFWELDREMFDLYLYENPKFLENGYENIKIENLDNSLNIKTIFGEPIRVIDAANNLLIVRVSGEGYTGNLACIKNTNQIIVAKAENLGKHGDLIEKFSKDNDALVAMNASGFTDIEWKGNGGQVTGSLVIDGEDFGIPIENLKFFGIKKDSNKFYIENLSNVNCSEYKWGIQFSPALIVDGNVFVQDSFGHGLQPRSAIGQTYDGEMLMLVVDGRRVGHSLGCTVGDLSEIMLRHKAYQAMNLDGGSSSIMTYRGKVINKPSSKTEAGRYLPCAFIATKISE